VKNRVDIEAKGISLVAPKSVSPQKPKPEPRRMILQNIRKKPPQIQKSVEKRKEEGKRVNGDLEAVLSGDLNA
jgi:hypothetical protein